MNNLLIRILPLVCMLTTMLGFSQETKNTTDSIAAVKILQDNLQLYNHIDSLKKVISDFEIKLRNSETEATLNQAKLEGKINVNNTQVEAKNHEINYMLGTINEKDKIISEKTSEIEFNTQEKNKVLRTVDSLSLILNAREIELVKLNDKSKIIESQYAEMIAQQVAAQNRKKKIRFVQGVALKGYRTPDFQLAPQSSATTATYVITNKNSGKIEFDYLTGVSVSLYDLTELEGKYTYDAGMFFGFGGTNLFKNFYLAPSFKAFDYFHFMLGLNFAEYLQLQKGFKEGDALPPGMSIPTVKQWKANIFFGMTLDFELLSNITRKI